MMNVVQLDARTVDATSISVWAEDLWDGHGPAVYFLACAVLGDETAAMRAVALGMTDFVREDTSTPADDIRRTLARHVYRRTTELANEPSPSTEMPPLMGCLTQLAQLQRASLALCTYGGHTYGDAAEVLGVAPLTVAQLLTSGLDELSRLSAPVFAS